MKQAIKLTIGGAQFGMDYGVTNTTGKITKNEFKKIIDYAIVSKIESIDTAAAYGDSEITIGNEDNCAKFEVDTKISAIIEGNDQDKCDEVMDARLSQSQINLRRKEIRVLYFHDNDKNTENRLKWALQKKNLGIVKEIGLSVYELSEIKTEWIDYLDTIQIPMSLYDRRAENHPLLKVLVEKEVKIRARSIFMQGLILEKHNNWPSYMSKELKGVHKMVSKEVERQKRSMLELAVEYIRELGVVHEIVVGITSEKELREITNAFNKRSGGNAKRIENSVFTSSAVDPRYWKR